MAQYDGSIRINTEITAKQAEKELKSLESSISKTADKITSLRSKMDALKDVKTPTTEYKNLQKELGAATREMEKLVAQDSKLADIDAKIKKLSQSASEYASRMKEVAEQKIPTKEYTSLEKEWESLEKRLIKIGENRERFLAGGGKERDPSFRRMSYDMKSIEERMDSIASKMKKMEESGKDFTLGTGTDQYKNISAKYESINAELEKQKGIHSEIAQKQADAVQKTFELKGQIQQLVEEGKAFTFGSDTEQYAQMSAQMQQLNRQMESDTQHQSELQSALASEEKRLAQIKANSTVSDQQIIDLLERRKQLIAEIRDMEAAGVGLGYRQYENANRELEEINEKIKVYRKSLGSVPEKFDKMRKSANKAFDAVANGTKKSSGLLSTFASRLKGIALSLLIFNWISKAFNAMITGMKKGFENLMNYSNGFANSVQIIKNSMATLGNQFAAAFSPIVQMVIPWLNSLINAISKAMTYVAQFIAILGGKSTFTRAKQVQDAYNKSLGGTAKAADKARGALARFDDLDVWQKQENDSGGGGGGDVGGELFEEVPVDPKVQGWLDSILDKLKPILGYINELKNAFMEGFWDGLGDWEYRWDIIKNGLEQIKNVLIDIWTDPAVLAAADAWLKSLMYMLGSLVGSVASIALTIAAAFIGGLGEYMENNVDRIKTFLISAFNIGAEINYLLADLFQSIAYIFEAFASEGGIRFVAALIGSIADAGMGIIEIALKLGRDILKMIILPITENKEEFRVALEGLLSSAATILEGFKESIDSIFDNLNTVYDTHFKPFFDSVANGLSSLVGTALDAWNGSIQPILDNAAQKISILLSQYITPFVNGVIEFIGNLVDMFLILWEMLEPHIEWLISYAIPLLGSIFSDFFEQVIAVIEFLMGIFNVFINFLNETIIPIWKQNWDDAMVAFDLFCSIVETLVSFIIDIITAMPKMVQKCIQGDWKGSWELAQNIFVSFKEKIESIVDIIKGILEGFFSWINEMIQSVIDGLSGIGTSASKTSKSGGGGYSAASYSISPTAYRSAMTGIPHLASGSVIRGGNPFLAILGDQPRGITNVETPLPTMIDAFKQAIADSGMTGSDRVPVNINLIYDGETFARLALDDILSEAARRGLDVSVLGVN